MSIYTHNWESVMNLDNRMLNIDKKNTAASLPQIHLGMIQQLTCRYSNSTENDCSSKIFI